MPLNLLQLETEKANNFVKLSLIFATRKQGKVLIAFLPHKALPSVAEDQVGNSEHFCGTAILTPH
jgi:hypothetical protein